jgi:hypothetical protein
MAYDCGGLGCGHQPCICAPSDIVVRLRAPERWRSFPDIDDEAPREAASEIERLRLALVEAEDETRRFAAFYPPFCDSWNTFILLADKIAALADQT